jgi:hypothetical protein
MVKNDHKAHVAANQFDLNTLLDCGPKLAQAACVSIKTMFVTCHGQKFIIFHLKIGHCRSTEPFYLAQPPKDY